MQNYKNAPALSVSTWLNTTDPITLESLRGKVVLLKAFQMLCPGCVSHALPQAIRVRDLFSPADVAVIGLHSVFEHHAAQGSKEALEAFLHEYRITFPVAIDAQSAQGGLPQTMGAFQMQGTPTTILIDREGRLRKHKFGAEQDMILGAEIMALIREGDIPAQNQQSLDDQTGCTDTGCAVPTA